MDYVLSVIIEIKSNKMPGKGTNSWSVGENNFSHISKLPASYVESFIGSVLCFPLCFAVLMMEICEFTVLNSTTSHCLLRQAQNSEASEGCESQKGVVKRPEVLLEN